MRSNAMSMVGCQDKQKAILFVCPPPSPLANISRWHGQGPTDEPSRDHPLIWQGGVIRSWDQGRWWPLHWLAASLVIVDNLGLGEEDNYQEEASLVLFGFLRQLQASTECSGERFCKICPTARPPVSIKVQWQNGGCYCSIILRAKSQCNSIPYKSLFVGVFLNREERWKPWYLSNLECMCRKKNKDWIP